MSEIRVAIDSVRFPKSVEKLSAEQRRSLRRLAEALTQRIPPPWCHCERVQGNRKWRSARLDSSSGYRVIYYEEDGYRVLCHVAPHDDAYAWARRNRRPSFNEYGEYTVFEMLSQESEEPAPAETPIASEADTTRYPFAAYSATDLERLGAPRSEVPTLQTLEREDLRARLANLRQNDCISESAYERLDLLLEGEPLEKLLPPAQVNRSLGEVFQEAIRRGTLWEPRDFDELENYLQHPWERWLVFLNASQQEAAKRQFSGPARVTGGPGTGKTIVLLHRTKNLVERYPQQPILLTTFNRNLANELKRRAGLLMIRGIPPQLTIQHFDEFVQEQLRKQLPNVKIVYNADELKQRVNFNQLWSQQKQPTLSPEFIWQEWEQVVDAWNLRTEEEYLNFKRTGRGRRLDENAREALWRVFVEIRTRLRNAGIMTGNQVCYELARRFRGKPPFRCVLVDEAQDFGPAQMHLLRLLAPEDEPDNLFFCIDVAQRIYARSVPWKEYGINIAGRSTRLRINYRNTLEIQQQAERVLPTTAQIELAKLMDDPETVREAIQAGWRPIPCLRNPDHPPVLRRCKSATDEAEQLLAWVEQCKRDGIDYCHIAIVGRTKDAVDELVSPLLQKLGLAACPIGEGRVASEYEINIGTAHAIKGLEFRAVAIVAAHLFPLKVDAMLNPDTREDFLQRERNLLFMAMTRPRERLYISWVGEAPLLTGGP
jgi:superfamily I DNA/RNA helicase/mRNA-degrading endonuclease RelE of RelBE toxin-antitoxin system